MPTFKAIFFRSLIYLTFIAKLSPHVKGKRGRKSLLKKRGRPSSHLLRPTSLRS